MKRLPRVGLWLMALGLAACSGDGGRVTIPPGATFRAAADSLAAHGVIRYPRAFTRYAAWTGRDRQIKPGMYEFASGQSWGDVLDAMASGRSLVRQITIPEGWNLDKIVPQLARVLEIPEDSVDAAVSDSATRARLGVPTSRLEGYLYPDTYFFTPGTSARAAVATMIQRFEAVWKPEWTQRAAQLGLSRHQLMALAAIVELEAKVPSERPIISAVYHNRLRIGMRLQADPTVQYARGKHAARVLYKDLEIDSPFNTYKHAGLPPGPIASPGAPSIDAAANPADVPWLYFVAHPDGHHEFRRTYSEHLAAIRDVRSAAREAEAEARP